MPFQARCIVFKNVCEVMGRQTHKKNLEQNKWGRGRGRGTAKNNRNPNPEGEMYYTYNFDFPVHFLVFTLIFLSVSKKGPTV